MWLDYCTVNCLSNHCWYKLILINTILTTELFLCVCLQVLWTLRLGYIKGKSTQTSAKQSWRPQQVWRGQIHHWGEKQRWSGKKLNVIAVWNLDWSPLHDLQSLRNDAELQEGNMSWLKTRLSALIEVCTESDAQRQGAALSKLSTDFKGLLISLSEVRHTH